MYQQAVLIKENEFKCFVINSTNAKRTISKHTVVQVALTCKCALGSKYEEMFPARELKQTQLPVKGILKESNRPNKTNNDNIKKVVKKVTFQQRLHYAFVCSTLRNDSDDLSYDFY